ncbi:hypothetical protein VTK26DRAFT_2548 [Humicola hyalothermophila]
MEKDPEKAPAPTSTSDSDRAEADQPIPAPIDRNGGAGDNPAAANEVPDGGLTAWLQVVGSAAILVSTWGVINTFGVFQAYYETSLLAQHSPSTISWIGSAQGALLFLVGVVAGPLFDAGYFRQQLAVGLALIVVGQFTTSVCKEYWQVMLAQGIAMGIGMGLTFLPSTAVLGQYFRRHRALALGLSSVGSPVAGTVFPILFGRVEESAGFGWATRAIAFILLGMSAIALAVMRTRVPPTGRVRAIIDRTALRDGAYLAFVVGGLFAFLALYVPFFYITLYATSRRVTSQSFAPYLVTLLNAGSIVGRVVPNALADRVGSLNMIIACAFGSAVLVFGWLGIDNLGGSIVYVLLYGAFSGGVVSLVPSVLVSLSPDMGRVGARMGMSFVVSGVAILVGTPIAGAILGDEGDPEWLGTILYAAFGLLVATTLYSTSRFLLYKKEKKWKG